MGDQQCKDLQGDRELGAYWERAFCVLAAYFGFSFTPMQLGRETSAQAFSKLGGQWNHWTLPDITVWTHPGQHHEIKHKAPTRYGSFSLEAYRLDALVAFAHETQQDVMYTIHNHALNGGRLCKNNCLDHWLTVNVLDLQGAEDFHNPNGQSWVNGERRTGIPIYYWNVELWEPLAEYWNVLQPVLF